ncbi:MAG: LysM peptidoglycan-binding domain-containing protein [Anaerolineae bacterium]
MATAVWQRLLPLPLAVVLACFALLTTTHTRYADEPQPRLHLVTWGETLSGIALQYGVSLDELMRANSLKSDMIHAGEQLVIPVPASTPSAEQAGSASQPVTGKVHVVAFGETLYSIALMYGADMYALAQANGIANPDLIQPGQQLLIPAAPDGQSSVVATPASSASSGGQPDSSSQVYHIVRFGETLIGIALEYGVSADTLALVNGIANPSLIYSGQRLLIPSAQESAAEPQPTPQPSSNQTVLVAPNERYGVCAHLLDQDLNATLGAVQGLGFNWVKQQIEWKLFEPSKGQIQWQALDQIVAAAASRGLHLLLSVVKAPAWARPEDTDFSVDGPPANTADYADFVGALATRYKGRVAAYEIWNEQNLWYEWGGKGKLSAAAYVALLREAYQRIKAADPSAIVVSGGLTPTGVNDGYVAFDDVHYLGQMYAAGAAAYFDALGAHPSGYNNPPDDSPERNSTATTQFKGHWSFYFRRFEQLRDVMVLNGDGSKQIWFTEFGWSSQAQPPAGYEYAADNSEQQQATYLYRAFEIAREKPYVGVMFIWNLNYAAVVGPADEKAGFSLVRADGSLRPAYLALALMPK